MDERFLSSCKKVAKGLLHVVGVEWIWAVWTFAADIEFPTLLIFTGFSGVCNSCGFDSSSVWKIFYFSRKSNFKAVNLQNEFIESPRIDFLTVIIYYFSLKRTYLNFEGSYFRFASFFVSVQINAHLWRNVKIIRRILVTLPFLKIKNLSKKTSNYSWRT